MSEEQHVDSPSNGVIGELERSSLIVSRVVAHAIACMVTVVFLVVTLAVVFGYAADGKVGESSYSFYFLGTLTSTFAAVVQYYLGSSAGSAAKDGDLRRMGWKR